MVGPPAGTGYASDYRAGNGASEKRGKEMTQPKQILDFLTEAVHRYIQEGDQGISWVFFQGMTSDDRLRFDLWLVKMKDRLAWQAGSTEWRFKQRVKAMAEAYQTPGGLMHGEKT